MRSAIEQFYNKEGQPPKELLVPTDLSDALLIEQWLSEKRGDAVRLLTRSGARNISWCCSRKKMRAAAIADHLRNEALDRQATAELGDACPSDVAPRRIEGFDISNIMGNQSVASLVVWEDGQAKADYRKFRIQTVEGANDFASMQEAVMRRYGATEDLARPDLILIDGGLGQLSAAIEGLKHVGQEQIPIIGLAKARGEKDERIFLPGVRIPSSCGRPPRHTPRAADPRRSPPIRASPITGICVAKRCSSELDQIVGIGKIRRKRLLKLFGSVQHIAAATDDQLKTAGLDRHRRCTT